MVNKKQFGARVPRLGIAQLQQNSLHRRLEWFLGGSTAFLKSMSEIFSNVSWTDFSISVLFEVLETVVDY